jgi:hypothetical protein
MSGIGSALSGLVGGFIDGRNVRHGWEDRKDNKKRQERLDQIRDAQERRSEEAHRVNLEGAGLINDSRRQANRATEQGWDDSEAMRDALDAADAAATAGIVPMGATPAPVVPVGPQGPALIPSTPPSTSGQPVVPAAPAQPTASSAQPAPTSQPLSFGAMPAAGNDVLAGGAGSDALAAAPPQPRLSFGAPSAPAGDPLFEQGADGKMVALRVPKTAEERKQIADLARQGRLGMAPERAQQQQGIDAGADPSAPSVSSVPFVRDMQALGSGVAATGSLWGEQALNAFSDAADTVNKPFRMASEYFTGTDFIGAAPRADLNGDGRNTSIVSPVMDIMRPAPETPAKAAAALAAEPDPSGKNKSAAQVAQTASDTMDAVGDSPAMKAAADALPVGELGATPGKPMTEGQRNEMADSYMESYRKNGAPLVMRELVRQGRIEEAEKFDQFIRSQQAQEGMDHWMRGVVAAQAGDIDTAADSLMDAYNSSGYFADGYEIDKQNTSLIKDESGEVVGINLSVRNIATGEVINQTDTITGFMEKAIWMTSPEKAFEAAMEAQAKMQAAMIEAEKDRQKAATDVIKGQFDWDNRAAIEIYKGGIGLDGKPTMTWPEAQAATQGGGASAIPDSEVPVLRAPR